MNYRVGPWRYKLRIADAALFLNGEERMGLCCEKSRELLISPECPPAARLGMFFHELAHAWIYHTGEPRTVEDLCDLFATMTAAALDDLCINGGKEAILRLTPGESPSPGAAKIALTRNRYCGKCQSTIAGFSVECKPSALPGVLDLSLFCEHCNHVQRWQEMATASGLPSGTHLGEPSFEKPAEELRVVPC